VSAPSLVGLSTPPGTAEVVPEATSPAAWQAAAGAVAARGATGVAAVVPLGAGEGGPRGVVVPEDPGARLLAGALARRGLPVRVATPDRLRAVQQAMVGTEATRSAGGDLPPSAVVGVPGEGPGLLLGGGPSWPAAEVDLGAEGQPLLRVLREWLAATGSREVLLAAPRSFCAGVERAIEIVERALERFGPPVYVRRQIVHNRHVVAELEAKGAVFVEEVAEVPPGATLVLAAHGVAPEVHEAARARAGTVVDATCPLVAKVHREARRFAAEGRHVILVGHAEHEEVQGTVGEIRGQVSVIASPEEVAGLPLAPDQPLAYLTQTTLALDETGEVLAALRDRFPGIVGPSADDICYASQNRQDAVRALAQQADLVLVVGSRNSSNTARLVEVARRAGCPAELVEDDSELRPGWLIGRRRIGVTAGASAPERLVQQVVGAVGSLGAVAVREVRTAEEHVRFTLPQKVR
jgi:4-hydroxy-3-methylbut-2-enyl diphosphate reductase